jgi:tRNA pseudouridine55 synthase
MQSPEPQTANRDLCGVFIIDKPAGWTSHDVVAALRRLLHTRQVGHFGTLDPFATGVLPLSVGKATRFAQFYLKSRKVYQGAIRFGHATDTFDATGQPSSDRVTPHLELGAVERVFRDFTGRLMQTPPPFSAKRVGGVRAYELARQRKPFALAPVDVEVYALELLSIQGDLVGFAVECSGGTYVRSLAHDIGQRLGCPAHLASLRRTAVAEFTENRAVTLAKLAESDQQGELDTWRVPLEALLPECPALVVRGREEISVRHGHAFELAQAFRPEPAGRGPVMTVLKILNAERRLIAVARHVAGSVYHPDLVLA